MSWRAASSPHGGAPGEVPWPVGGPGRQLTQISASALQDGEVVLVEHVDL